MGGHPPPSPSPRLRRSARTCGIDHMCVCVCVYVGVCWHLCVCSTPYHSILWGQFNRSDLTEEGYAGTVSLGWSRGVRIVQALIHLVRSEIALINITHTAICCWAVPPAGGTAWSRLDNRNRGEEEERSNGGGEGKHLLPLANHLQHGHLTSLLLTKTDDQGKTVHLARGGVCVLRDWDSLYIGVLYADHCIQQASVMERGMTS